VLPAGLVPTNPLELISTHRFREFIEQLAGQYDRVIIDSAPLKAVSDSLILATLADSLVYVTKADSTAGTLVLKGINQLRYSNLPFTGVVLNQLDTKKQRAYSDNYYNSYYGYGADEPAGDDGGRGGPRGRSGPGGGPGMAPAGAR
jgi:Mrp family chromosome partitioning ATPase